MPPFCQLRCRIRSSHALRNIVNKRTKARQWWEASEDTENLTENELEYMDRWLAEVDVKGRLPFPH